MTRHCAECPAVPEAEDGVPGEVMNLLLVRPSKYSVHLHAAFL